MISKQQAIALGNGTLRGDIHCEVVRQCILHSEWNRADKLAAQAARAEADEKIGRLEAVTT